MNQLPRLGKRELICLLSFTCNYVVFVWRDFLFLWVLGMGYVILLWHSLSLPYNYSSSTISNIFFSETAWPIKAFYVEPPWVGGTKVCSLHLSHMTKMAAMPIYIKNLSKIFFTGTGKPISTKLGV